MSAFTDTGTARVSSSARAPIVAVSWRLIILATAGIFALATVLNISVHTIHDLYVTFYVTSAHLVTPTFIISGVLFVVTMIGLVTFGKLQPRDLGWQWSKVGVGLALTAVVWIGMQLVELIAAVASGAATRLSPDWAAGSWTTAIGALLGLALGLAPAEETYFRGFLLPQMQLRFSDMRAIGAVAVAIFVSQLIFALYHLPNLVMGNSGHVGTTTADIVIQLGLDFVIGVVYAGLYLRTGNLFLVIGIHALQDAGTSIVATPIDPSLVIFTLALVLLLVTFAPALTGRIIR